MEFNNGMYGIVIFNQCRTIENVFYSSYIMLNKHRYRYHYLKKKNPLLVSSEFIRTKCSSIHVLYIICTDFITKCHTTRAHINILVTLVFKGYVSTLHILCQGDIINIIFCIMCKYYMATECNTN